MYFRLFHHASASAYRFGINARLTRWFQPVNNYHHFRTHVSSPGIGLSSTRKLSTSAPVTPNTQLAPADQSTYETITETTADYLQTFHDTISFDVLPWTATLPLVALSLRVITFPIVYYSQLHAGRAAIAAKELPKIHYFVRNTPGTLWQKYRTFRRLRSLTYRAAGTSPMRQFPWHVACHVPLLISSSLGVRGLASRQPAEWSTAGPPFAPDLLAPDPTGVLPILTTALWLWNVDPRLDTRRKASKEISIKQSDRSRMVDIIMTKAGEAFTTFLQVVIVMSMTVTTTLPSGVVLFWASNALVTMLQRFLLSREYIRRLIDLPTAKDIVQARETTLMPAIEQSMEQMRNELSYIQQRMLAVFRGRAPDEDLCADVNRLLKRERWNGRVANDLEAVLRKDERDGKKYVAIIRRGASEL